MKSSNGSWPALIQSRSSPIAETITLRTESYDKDEFPAEGWPTTIAAFRHNPVPCYVLGWCFDGKEVDTCTLQGTVEPQ